MDGTREILKVGTRWSCGLALPLCFGLWIIAPNLLQAWLGEARPDTVLVLRLTCAAVFAEALGHGAMQVLWAGGAARTVLLAQVRPTNLG